MCNATDVATTEELLRIIQLNHLVTDMIETSARMVEEKKEE